MEHLMQWKHLFKSRHFNLARIEQMKKLNTECLYRDEPYFARKNQIELLNTLVDQQTYGMQHIQDTLLTEDEQNETILFALGYEPIKRGP